MRRLIAALSLGFAFSGCGQISPLPQPSAGYETIKFRSAISVRDHAFNLYHFGAGSTFVADRTTESGLVYCGQAAINDDPRLLSVCLGFKGGNTIVIGPGSGIKEVERTLLSGTIESVRMRV